MNTINLISWSVITINVLCVLANAIVFVVYKNALNLVSGIFCLIMLFVSIFLMRAIRQLQ